MKRRRPKPRLEDVGPELLTRYIQERTPFRAKSTVYALMSRMRCFGEFLVREGVWIDNPLKWMQGPKVTPYHRMPKRIDAGDMRMLWKAAVAPGRSSYRKHLGITVLSLLYGTGLRRGELQRLNVADWNREDGTLRIDGRKTGKQRAVAVPSIVYQCIETFLPHRHNHLEKHGRLGSRRCCSACAASACRRAAADKHPISKLMATIEHLLPDVKLPFQYAPRSGIGFG